MPIKGVSEIRRVSRGGHIRLGVMIEAEKNGKTISYPQKSDHFIADFENKALETRFYELYGPKPTRITVAFAANDPSLIFPQWYKCYGKSTGLKCRGDGETCQRVIETEIVEMECPTPDDCGFAAANASSGKGKDGCKRTASLRCL